VKPLHLNLAARPYRDYRPVYAAVVVMSLLAAYLMLNNIETYFRYTRDTRSTRAKIASLEAQTQQERDREQSVQQRIKGLDLGRLSAQTKFVNAKLSERAFSWSTLLDELESVMSDDVRLLSVAPRFVEDGTISLAMEFRSKSADGMIKTINRMHADPQFRNPFPSSQSVVPDGGGYSFLLTVQYVPPPISAGVRLSEAPR
jgi:type IV pilus assembly protein PilN